MSDSTPTADPQTADPENSAPQGMSINAQYLRDLSFENPRAPFAAPQGTQPAISIDMNVRHRTLEGRTHESVLTVRANAKVAEDTIFLVECDYGAVVTFGADVPDDAVEPLLLVEVPRLLFPFARQIVADAVQQGGFPPLMLNPIDFRVFLQQKQAQGSSDNAVAVN